MDSLKKITGTWRGSYAYDPSNKLNPVPFTLILKQGWFGRFSGSVTDNAGLGMPGTGIIKGHFSYPRIDFYKTMPVSFVRTVDGRKISLRDSLIEKGYVCDHDIPHMPIFYSGEFCEQYQARGTWIIQASLLKLENHKALKLPETKGTWVMEADAVFISDKNKK
jgi:hypothetical protein